MKILYLINFTLCFDIIRAIQTKWNVGPLSNLSSLIDKYLGPSVGPIGNLNSLPKMNKGPVSTRSSFIRRNTGPVSTRSTFIRRNTGPVSTQSSFIRSNTGPFSTESSFIRRNTGPVSTESSFIRRNTGLVSTQSSYIRRNTGPVSTRSLFIRRNTGPVSTQSSFIRRNVGPLSNLSSLIEKYLGPSVGPVGNLNSLFEMKAGPVSTRSSFITRNTGPVSTQSSYIRRNTGPVSSRSSFIRGNTGSRPVRTRTDPLIEKPSFSQCRSVKCPWHHYRAALIDFEPYVFLFEIKKLLLSLVKPTCIDCLTIELISVSSPVADVSTHESYLSDISVLIAFNYSRDQVIQKYKEVGLGLLMSGNYLSGPLDKLYQAGIIWPVMGSSSPKMDLKSGYNYIPIVKAPGYIYFTKFGETSFDRAIASILKSYPLLLICLLMSIITGFVIWIIETFVDKEEFPRPAHRGWLKGIYWSVLTLFSTGVDSHPRSIISKLISVVWLLLSVILVAILTSTITAKMMEPLPKPTMEGAKVGVMKGPNDAVNFVKRHKGEPITYNSFTMLQDALHKNEINGYICDKYHHNWLEKMVIDKELERNGEMSGKRYGKMVETPMEASTDSYYGMIINDIASFGFIIPFVKANSSQLENRFREYFEKKGNIVEARRKEINNLRETVAFSINEDWTKTILINLSSIVAAIFLIVIFYECCRQKRCNKVLHLLRWMNGIFRRLSRVGKNRVGETGDFDL